MASSMPVQHVGESDEDFAVRLEAHRAKRRKYEHARRQDPAIAARARAAQRKYRASNPAYVERCRARDRARIATPPGHSGACDICGVVPEPDRMGRRGLHQDHRHDNNVIRGFLCAKCNREVAVMDYAFTDPDRYAALKAWSARGAPVVSTVSARPTRRRQATEQPVLFGGAK